MSTGELLSIEPQELQFPFELKKQISCSLQLTNKTSNYVAFKVKTTNPKKYCVRPNTGIVLPHSTSDVIVTMQAQKEAPADMQCKDKFLLQSAVTSPGATTKDITPEMFHKESGNTFEECKLRVSYVAPPQPPSPVREGSDEGSSPRVSASDNGNLNTAEYTTVSILDVLLWLQVPLPKGYMSILKITHQSNRLWELKHYCNFSPARSADFTCHGCPSKLANDFTEILFWNCPPANLLHGAKGEELLRHFHGGVVVPNRSGVKAKAFISKLTQEKNSAIQQNNKLQQELELLRRKGNRSSGGIPFIYVIIVGVLGIFLGFLLKKT
ncbi:hypothetical protein RHSIM_Rhsim01G0151000 [Rhododendron simsii]|uniref:MSP domain-containing protein n=1 Tax=Rhododendron simsii TaxID=118357 RepID=A0A834HHM5_RHOSS|nr:hypothetical protein RHSIM_Rhsim01G0151000 [Rhododendron simsii]